MPFKEDPDVPAWIYVAWSCLQSIIDDQKEVNLHRSAIKSRRFRAHLPRAVEHLNDNCPFIHRRFQFDEEDDVYWGKLKEIRNPQCALYFLEMYRYYYIEDCNFYPLAVQELRKTDEEFADQVNLDREYMRRKWFIWHDFAVAEEDRILRVFKYLVEKDWEVERGSMSAGVGDLILSDGHGCYLVCKTKYLPRGSIANTGDTGQTNQARRQNRNVKKRQCKEQCVRYTKLWREQDGFQFCPTIGGIYYNDDGFEVWPAAGRNAQVIVDALMMLLPEQERVQTRRVPRATFDSDSDAGDDDVPLMLNPPPPAYLGSGVAGRMALLHLEAPVEQRAPLGGRGGSTERQTAMVPRGRQHAQGMTEKEDWEYPPGAQGGAGHSGAGAHYDELDYEADEFRPHTSRSCTTGARGVQPGNGAHTRAHPSYEDPYGPGQAHGAAYPGDEGGYEQQHRAGGRSSAASGRYDTWAAHVDEHRSGSSGGGRQLQGRPLTAQVAAAPHRTWANARPATAAPGAPVGGACGSGSGAGDAARARLATANARAVHLGGSSGAGRSFSDSNADSDNARPPDSIAGSSAVAAPSRSGTARAYGRNGSVAEEADWQGAQRDRQYGRGEERDGGHGGSGGYRAYGSRHGKEASGSSRPNSRQYGGQYVHSNEASSNNLEVEPRRRGAQSGASAFDDNTADKYGRLPL